MDLFLRVESGRSWKGEGRRREEGSGTAEPGAKPALPHPDPSCSEEAPLPSQGGFPGLRRGRPAGSAGGSRTLWLLSQGHPAERQRHKPGGAAGGAAPGHPPAPSRCLMAELPPLRPRRCCPCSSSSSSSPAPAARRPGWGSQASLCSAGDRGVPGSPRDRMPGGWSFALRGCPWMWHRAVWGVLLTRELPGCQLQQGQP